MNTSGSAKKSNASHSPSVPSLTPKKDLSYLQRYRGKKQLLSRSPRPSPESTYLEQQLSQRGDKLIDLFTRGEDISSIKIQQQQQSEMQVMRNQYLQTELLWFKKIDQTKHQIASTRQQCEKQTKIIRDLQRQLSEKRTKLIQLSERLERLRADHSAIQVETHETQIQRLQHEYDTIMKHGEQLLTNALGERDQLLKENSQADEEIQQIKRQIESLGQYGEEQYNTTMSGLLAEQERLESELNDMQEELITAQREMRIAETQRPVREQTHRKYLQLYEKMLANRQLDKFQQLVNAKQSEISRLEDYQKKKALFQLKKGDIEERQTRLIVLGKTLQALEEEIREKSTILLNLYQYQSQKMR